MKGDSNGDVIPDIDLTEGLEVSQPRRERERNLMKNNLRAKIKALLIEDCYLSGATYFLIGWLGKAIGRIIATTQ